MSRHTFPYSSASLRSLRLEQEQQDWEDARRALAQRRALMRAALPPAPRVPRRPSASSSLFNKTTTSIYCCRDQAVHNTFLCGNMAGVYAVLKDPTMVNAVMETVQEEMMWAPEMGMWTLTSKTRQTSPLRMAAGKGHTACVEELLFRGADVDAATGGRSALHDACTGGHVACVQILLDHGADANLSTADGNTALNLCSSQQSFPCAELLVLKGGASVNTCSTEGKLSPLHIAAQHGLEHHVQLLLQHGADVAVCNHKGETPLNMACSGAERPSEAGRYLRVIEMLLHAGADPRVAGRKQHTPLHNACGNCSARIAELLLQHGACADAKNGAGYTPMDCLLQVVEDFPDQNPEAVASSLLNRGAKPVSPKDLKLCCLSPPTLEVMLNCYEVIPSSCEDWLECVPRELQQEHQSFFDSVRQMAGQPRSLQHLSRCSLRHHLGPLCHSVITQLNVPLAIRDYLLLGTGGQLR